MKFKHIPTGRELLALTKLRLVTKRLNIDQADALAELTVEKCFAEAEYYEKQYADYPPGDPGRTLLWTMRERLLNAAAYLDELSDCIDFSSGKFKTLDELSDALHAPNAHPEIAALTAAAANKE